MIDFNTVIFNRNRKTRYKYFHVSGCKSFSHLGSGDSGCFGSINRPRTNLVILKQIREILFQGILVKISGEILWIAVNDVRVYIVWILFCFTEKLHYIANRRNTIDYVYFTKRLPGRP